MYDIYDKLCAVETRALRAARCSLNDSGVEGAQALEWLSFFFFFFFFNHVYSPYTMVHKTV